MVSDTENPGQWFPESGKLRFLAPGAKPVALPGAICRELLMTEKQCRQAFPGTRRIIATRLQQFLLICALFFNRLRIAILAPILQR
jgi:hypothetical protein